MEWPLWQAYQQEIAERNASRGESQVVPATEASDPLEAMSTAERAYNAQTETELRKRLQESSPTFFEKAVVDLLWAMGNGLWR